LMRESGRGMLPMGSVCMAAVYSGPWSIFLDQKVEAI
jgi:hypothetical protein